MQNEKIIQAGKIAAEVKKYARKITKKDVPLLDIAEKIENKIFKLGGKIGFPVNLSINEIAAHYTPSYDDKTKAYGLLKVDLGVHIDGYLSDTAFSLDLENSEENKKLISTSEKALENAINLVSEKKQEIKTNEIGEEIEKTIKKENFIPILNLSGHSIENYDLHSGISIPNYKEKKGVKLNSGLYAIEPFVTLNTGAGKVKDGKPSGIYMLIDNKNIRSFEAREILEYIEEEYKTLPFCSRWLVKKFGTKVLFALRQLEINGNLHQFSQLIESSGKKVAQTENTILIKENGEVIVTTKE